MADISEESGLGLIRFFRAVFGSVQLIDCFFKFQIESGEVFCTQCDLFFQRLFLFTGSLCLLFLLRVEAIQ